jgi:hypothetical protein
MPDVVEEDESLDPVAVALFGAAAIVAGPQGRTEAVEELRFLPCRQWDGGA